LASFRVAPQPAKSPSGPPLGTENGVPLEERISTANGSAEVLCKAPQPADYKDLFGLEKAQYESLEARKQAAKAEAWALVCDDILQARLEREGKQEGKDYKRIKNQLVWRTGLLEWRLKELEADVKKANEEAKTQAKAKGKGRGGNGT
jgi:hypothetical protein